MSQATMEIRRISGHAGSVPGAGASRDYDVCKLIDTTTCIGCKACEVACKEWNDVPSDGFEWRGMSYDNTGALGHSTWRHVKFIEGGPLPGFGIQLEAQFLLIQLCLLTLEADRLGMAHADEQQQRRAEIKKTQSEA